MTPVVEVPLNTAIADLDEGLRSLLRSDLRRHGFDGVEISFDAPSREWSGKLTGPAVNVFLYDLREARDRATSSPEPRAGALLSPPLRLALTYAVTAWTKAVEDEHRLLSQVPRDSILDARLPDGRARRACRAACAARSKQRSAARARTRRISGTPSGGQYKASIDYVVQIAVESGSQDRARTRRSARAPSGLRRSDGRATTMEELHGLGGTVRDDRGEPIAQAWIAVPDLGAWTASDLAGRLPPFPRRARNAPRPRAHHRRTGGRGEGHGPRRRRGRRGAQRPQAPQERGVNSSHSVTASPRSHMPTSDPRRLRRGDPGAKADRGRGDVDRRVRRHRARRPGQPAVRISNWTQFASIYGDPPTLRTARSWPAPTSPTPSTASSRTAAACAGSSASAAPTGRPAARAALPAADGLERRGPAGESRSNGRRCRSRSRSSEAPAPRARGRRRPTYRVVVTAARAPRGVRRPVAGEGPSYIVTKVNADSKLIRIEEAGAALPTCAAAPGTYTLECRRPSAVEDVRRPTVRGRRRPPPRDGRPGRRRRDHDARRSPT